MPKAEGKYFEFEGEDQINTDFLETFSFLVLGSTPKYLTSSSSPNLSTSLTLLVLSQAISLTCNRTSFPGASKYSTTCLLYTSPSPRD